ncbi:MAG: type IIL restriction-modification enzyme MmeI [Chthoniobacterales bacterium]
MSLSWSEIRTRAIAFSREWRGVESESAEKQSFWNDFFAVFGKKRRAVAAFEEPVKTLGGSWGRIDLFWPGTLLVEHKSAGEDLGQAESQGMAYIRALVDSDRENEAPRYLT